MEDTNNFVFYNKEYVPEYQMMTFIKRYKRENPGASKVAIVKAVRERFKTTLAYAHSQTMKILDDLF